MLLFFFFFIISKWNLVSLNFWTIKYISDKNTNSIPAGGNDPHLFIVLRNDVFVFEWKCAFISNNIKWKPPALSFAALVDASFSQFCDEDTSHIHQNSPHFPTCNLTQLILANCHQTQMPQRSSSHFNTFDYYLIAAEFNQRRWRESAGFNQPLPAALPGSLQQQVRLINLSQTAPSARSSSLASHRTESPTWFHHQATSPGQSHIWMRA